MGLPGGKHVIVAGPGQKIMGHDGAEALDMPLPGAMQAELTIETLRPDLGRHLQIENA
jgi:hypothetical protein